MSNRIALSALSAGSRTGVYTMSVNAGKMPFTVVRVQTLIATEWWSSEKAWTTATLAIDAVSVWSTVGTW